MLESVKDHYAPAAPVSLSAIADEREAPMLFAPNDALEKLLPAERARRFADLRSSLREAHAPARAARSSAIGHARYGPRRIEVQHGSLGRAADRLREATKHYERHVLAWYALGRVTEARSAREAIVHYQQALATEPTNIMTGKLVKELPDTATFRSTTQRGSPTTKPQAMRREARRLLVLHRPIHDI